MVKRLLTEYRRISGKRPLLYAGLILIFADLFLVRDPAWLAENAGGVRFWVNYGLAVAGLFPLLYLVRVLLGPGRIRRAAGFLLVFLPVFVQSCYFSVYRKFVTPFGFRFIQDNKALTFSLLLDHVNVLRTLSLLFFTYIAVSTLFLNPPRRRIVPLIVCGVLFLGMLAHSIFGWYTVHNFQPGLVAYYSVMTDSFFRRTRTFKLDKPGLDPRPAADPGLCVVWVIGESTNLGHMGLYGYARNTTPKLAEMEKQKQVVAFKNAISVGNKTNLSVPYMLTGLEGPDPKGRFYKAPNIFDYAKSAGLATAFISAQDFRWGHMDKILIDGNVDLFMDGSFFSPGVDVLKGTDDMAVLEKGVFPFLNKAGPGFLLIIQMDGSHYPYSEHSPPGIKQFLPEESENCTNAYDNTIVYFDLYMERLVRAVRGRFPPAWIFFTPDHGQNLGGQAGWYNDNFMDNVVHNPLLVFPPEARYADIKRQENAPVSQIDIFATILDLLGYPPVKPIDGYSFLDSIPGGRLRICSAYMPTFHNNPNGVLFFPDYRFYKIDFEKKSVVLDNGKRTVRYRELPDSIRAYIDGRLE